MIYYRCKCGAQEAWSSMGIARCEACPDCNTILATGPSGNTAPEPHRYYVEKVETDQGYGGLTRCARCLKTKRELEAPIEIPFDHLVEHGLRTAEHLVDGVPWSFQFRGYAVTHENDDCYLIGSLRVNRGEVLLAVPGGDLLIKPR